LAYKFSELKSQWELVEYTHRFVVPPQSIEEQIRHDTHNSSGMGWNIHRTNAIAHCKYAQLNASGTFSKRWKY